MAERTEPEVLHHLIEICRDGERGFRAAAEYVREPLLKSLFGTLATQREQFAGDLVPHLRRLGGWTDLNGTSAGALHRGWMSLKAHVPGHVDHAIVAEAERGEQAALFAYDEALSGMLPPTARLDRGAARGARGRAGADPRGRSRRVTEIAMARTATMVMQTIWDWRWGRPGYVPMGVGVAELDRDEGLWVCVRPTPRTVRRPVTEGECATCPYWQAAFAEEGN